MNIVWSEPAKYDLSAIRDYLTAQKSLYIDDLLERIVARTAILETNPYVGSPVPEFPTYPYRELIELPYRILYEVRTNEVVILAVHHVRRRLPSTPRF